MKNLLTKLKKVPGVGRSSVCEMRQLFGVNNRKAAQFNLSYNGVVCLKKFLRVKKTAALLKAIIKKRINNFIISKSFKGMRHKNAYPVRGQRTHTNAKTQRKLSKVI